MKFLKKYFGDLFLPARFFIAGGFCALMFITAFFIPALYSWAAIVLLAFVLLLLADYFMLFIITAPPAVNRVVAHRLSNGDPNMVELNIRNRNRIGLEMEIIDELPAQLQERNFKLNKYFLRGQQHILKYTVTPQERGVYHFGDVILFAQTFIGFTERRFEIAAERSVEVYPSFMQMRNYQLITQTTNAEAGTQRKRKIGQSMEFEQIKDYVMGDDIRTINWKATARRGGSLMVNNYVDERSQQVFCVVDKGRLMKMPFNGLSLLDYAINATLALSNVCLQRQDKIGLLTFANRMGTLLPAERKPVQREHIMQALYNEETNFLESDYEMLYMQVRSKIKQRSLLILFTNFESVSGLKRHLNYLRSIAKHHLLLVVFFENTEMARLTKSDAESIEDIYIKTTAEKFVFEKRLVVKELQKYGIASILSTPEQLTVNSINKYLELKARQAI